MDSDRKPPIEAKPAAANGAVVPLDAGGIGRRLHQRGVAGVTRVRIFDEIGSTHEWLTGRAARETVAGWLCLAERQGAGRGRGDRRWLAEPGDVLMSAGLSVRRPVAELAPFSLVVGLAVRRALASLGLDPVYVKWPNDVHTGSGKIAGILVSVAGPASGVNQVVVSAGINLRSRRTAGAGLGQPVASVEAELGTGVDRAALVVETAAVIHGYADEFEREGFAPFRQRFDRHNAMLGRQVRVRAGDRLLVGEMLAIESCGRLRLRTPDGNVERIAAAEEVSLRSNP